MNTPPAFLRPAVVAFGLSLLLLSSCASPTTSSTTARSAAPGPVYDAIVVGAGLSGLTTAKELRAAGKNVLVLEATDRIGGRAMTDPSFSAPIDLGAAWLHGVKHNPLRDVAEQLGFHRAPSELDGPVFIGSHRLSPDEKKVFDRQLRENDEAMERASQAGKDQPASDFLPANSPYRALVAANVGPLESGAEIAQTSSADSAAFYTDPDDFLREGIGTFVARFGRDVPVQLNSPVTAIHYGAEADGGVLVTCADGRAHRGRRVVVTVSTGILAARRIAFNPELPPWKWAAIQSLPMGLLNKVVFQFNGDILPQETASAWVLYQRPVAGEARDAEVMAFVIKPLGANIVVGFYGAAQAQQFEKLGDRVAIDYAKAALADMYGAGLIAGIRDDATKVTHWGRNPWTLGSYSAALPGASKMHAELAKPVADRVFFAGEAAGPPEFNGSLAAAYVAGRKASQAVQASLAAERK